MNPPSPTLPTAATVSSLAMMTELIARLADAETVAAIAELLAQTLKWILPVEHVSLLEAVGGRLAAGAPARSWRLLPSGSPVELEGPFALAVARRAVVEVTDAEGSPFAPIGEPAMRSLLVMPLSDESGVIGTLNLASRDPVFLSRIDRALCPVLALNVAAQVRSARLLERERAARREADEAIRARDMLVASVTHDLRNPLTALSVVVEMMREGEGVQADDLVELDRGLRRMTGLIDELLDVTRFGAGQAIQVQRRRGELGALVAEAAGPVRRSSMHRLELGIPDQPVVGSFDEPRLARVLGNLVSNALKYSPRGGLIRIRLRAEGARATVEVSDSGIGIPAADLPRLFERFRRAGNVGAISGNGIGLAAAREIVERHGGDLRAESVEGQGSTMILELPLA